MKTIKLLLALIREIPDVMADRADGWVQDVHGVRADGTCSGHWKHTEWPCQDFIDATERRAARR